MQSVMIGLNCVLDLYLVMTMTYGALLSIQMCHSDIATVCMLTVP